MNEVALVVFDLVGTTIEDRGEVLEAFLGALRGHGIGVGTEDLQQWRGASKREVLRVCIERQFGPDDPGNTVRVEQAYADFRSRLEDGYSRGGVRPIAGAEETFVWLRERAIRVALTTGFYRKVTDLILAAVGWGPQMVDATICSDMVPRGRPAPYMIFRAMEATRVIDVRRVIVVGDTALDLMAGVSAGVRGVVGVLSGTQGVAQLGRVDHTHLVPSVADLPSLWDSSGGLAGVW